MPTESPVAACSGYDDPTQVPSIVLASSRFPLRCAVPLCGTIVYFVHVGPAGMAVRERS